MRLPVELPAAGALTRRSFIALLAALAASRQSVASDPPLARVPRYGAVVSRNPDDAVFGPLFVDLASALAAAPCGGQRHFIYVSEGVWREKLEISRANISLIGAGPDKTRILFGDAAGTLGPDGQALGTAGSASVLISAPGFCAEHLSISNDFDYVAARSRLAADPRGPNGLQAVALRLSASAHGAHLQNVWLSGHQDTLWVEGSQQRFDRCRIEGSVDFIFGAGTALFDRCEIHSRLRPDAGAEQGCISAPSTMRSSPVGLVFRECRLSADTGLPDGSVHLARPWRPGRAFADGRYGDPDAVGMACFLHCWLGAHVHPDAFTSMRYQAANGESKWLTPAQARFYVAAARGPAVLTAAPRTTLPTTLARAIRDLWPD